MALDNPHPTSIQEFENVATPQNHELPLKATNKRVHRAKRTLSCSSTSSTSSSISQRFTLKLPRARPACAVVDVPSLDTQGSFVPTSPVVGSLRMLVSTAGQRSHRKRQPLPVLFVSSRPPSLTRSASSASISLPASPTSSAPSIPSISRTTSDHELQSEPPSPELAWQRLPGPPSAPRTPAPDSPLLTPLDPGLAALEDASRLRTRCQCSHCGDVGYNFPRARTGEVWCSRECRLAARAEGKARTVCLSPRS